MYVFYDVYITYMSYTLLFIDFKVIDIITLSVLIFRVIIQLSTVLFKKINLVPIFFNMYPN